MLTILGMEKRKERKERTENGYMDMISQESVKQMVQRTTAVAGSVDAEILGGFHFVVPRVVCRVRGGIVVHAGHWLANPQHGRRQSWAASQ